MPDHFLKSILVKLFLGVLLAGIPHTSLQGQQNTSKYDSIRLKFEKDSAHLFRYRTVRPYLNIDLRNAYVTKSFLSLVGLKAGITLNSNHIMGIGYFFLNEFSILKSNRIKVYQFDNLNYLTLFYEYKLYNGRILDILLPFELGFGHYAASLTESPETKFSSHMIPAGFGIKFLIMPHQWIGLKIGGGYRYVWEYDAKVGMDGGYFSIGIRIDINHINADMRYSRLKKRYNRSLASI